MHLLFLLLLGLCHLLNQEILSFDSTVILLLKPTIHSLTESAIHILHTQNAGKWIWKMDLSVQCFCHKPTHATLCLTRPPRHLQCWQRECNYFEDPKYLFTSKAQKHNFVLWLTSLRYRWNVDLIQCCICQYSHISLLSPEPWLSSPTRIKKRQKPTPQTHYIIQSTSHKWINRKGSLWLKLWMWTPHNLFKISGCHGGSVG